MAWTRSRLGAIHDVWGLRTPRTQVVAIGAPEGIDPNALAEAFTSCSPTHADT
jgi:hypothetical protein